MIYYHYAKSRTKILRDGSKQNTFNRLYTLMGTDPNTGTYDNRVASAYSTYIKECGYTSGVKVDSYWLNLWSDFTRDVNNGLPIHTFLHVDGSGHSVVTVGWYIKRYGGTDFRYLQVLSGWSREIKYVPFDGYFNSISGIAIKI